jgi:sterol desaturase/sphingolipid hydroxylase (fatty acid hydroxylase superfamily)
LKQYHLRHHYKDDDVGFGISSPLWDYVFGTTRK